MSRVAIHRDAEVDLAAIRSAGDSRSADRIEVMLEQIATDPDLRDRLTQHDYGMHGTADFHVSRWQSQQRKHNRNLWRLKVWDLEEKHIRYRVVYAFEPLSGDIFVLGITPRRGFNYEDDTFTQRVIACYDRHFGGH